MNLSKKIILCKTKKGESLCAVKHINKNDIILKLKRRILKSSTTTSIQIDENKHIECKWLNIENHSCKPNSYFKYNDLSIRTLRKIKSGEEISFNYLTTEWNLHHKFKCKCGSKNCFQNIKGFKHLTLKQKKKLKPMLPPFLRNKLREIEAR